MNDQNSFLYARGRRIGSYLQMAGGLTKDAERSRSFIIQGRRRSSQLRVPQGGCGATNFTINGRFIREIRSSFPEKTFTAFRDARFLDWSQVFSQLAIGAATISLLE